MKKSILLFLFAFAIGVVVAVAVRVARYQPPAPAATVTTASVPSGDHSGHQHTEESPVPAESGTVNSVCPICGMDVDPSLTPATYEGKRVGFGCKACPPKFAADPDKYGPYALKNEVIP
jgi:YHS domain-containing protein